MSLHCLICDHLPCEYCETWCDRVIHMDDEVVLCCEGACIYDGGELDILDPDTVRDTILAAARYRRLERLTNPRPPLELVHKKGKHGTKTKTD